MVLSFFGGLTWQQREAQWRAKFPFQIGDKVRHKTWPSGVYVLVHSYRYGGLDRMTHGWRYTDKDCLLSSDWQDCDKAEEYFEKFETPELPRVGFSND